MNTYLQKLSGRKTALAIAGVATLFNVIGLGTDAEVLLVAGIILGIVSYVWGGGFGDVMSAGMSVAKFGWLIIPVFPVDLAVGMMTVAIALIIAILLPVVFVFISCVRNGWN